MLSNRSLKQTPISLSSCEAEFYAASACAGELLGLAELFKELHYDVAVPLEMDSESATHILQPRTRRTQTYRNTMFGNTTVGTRETSIRESSGQQEQHSRSLHETSGWIANTVAIQQWIRQKCLSVGRVDKKRTTADLFTISLRGTTNAVAFQETGVAFQCRHGRLRA